MSTSNHQQSGRVTFQAPSNIAIVKYWGKFGNQEPINPSISFTLTNSYTTTSVSYKPKESSQNLLTQFIFEGSPKPDFEPRISKYLESIKELLPILQTHEFVVESSNSFPHSSGIASSASSMAALALCLSKANEHVTGLEQDFKAVSNLARLGSGSGCRSVKGLWNLWGSTPLFTDSSNQSAIEIEDVNPIFNTLCDSILIIDPKKKNTSSSAGHSLMTNHPFKTGRIEQANQHIKLLLEALKMGDFDKFIEITESEALTLHGLMLSSNPSYSLMLPNTLEAIQRIRQFRSETGLPVCFTLDAGPNIHLIYPEMMSDKILPFINSQLLELCNEKRVIFDFIGTGAKQIIN